MKAILKTVKYYYEFFVNYPTPSNLTNLWNFGVLSFVMLIAQIVTGLGLSMYYVPDEILSFYFVEKVMRDVNMGWLFRYTHANGASLFFFFVYVHFFRGLYYFSYINPKTVIWNTGVIILLLMIITAFTGYVLPWGQMSFRACTVITSLATAIPFLGENLTPIVWGSYGVSTLTLNRFYTIHFFLPFIILLIMAAHFFYLHDVGSSNGLKVSSSNDKKKFHPYYTWKDAFIVVLMVVLFLAIQLLTPNALNHSDNYIEAKPLVTPNHIVPEWYFLSFYAMLRSVPNKFGGILVLVFSIVVLLWFPNSAKRHFNPTLWAQARTHEYHAYSKKFTAFVNKVSFSSAQRYIYWFFVFDFIGLSYIGMMPVEQPYINWGAYLTIGYFLFFTYVTLIHHYTWIIMQSKTSALETFVDIFTFIGFLLKWTNKIFNRIFLKLSYVKYKKYRRSIKNIKNFYNTNKYMKYFKKTTDLIVKIYKYAMDKANFWIDDYKEKLPEYILWKSVRKQPFKDLNYPIWRIPNRTKYHPWLFIRKFEINEKGEIVDAITDEDILKFLNNEKIENERIEKEKIEKKNSNKPK